MKTQVLSPVVKMENRSSAALPLSTLQLQFSLPLHHADIPSFRGAFAALAGRENHVFHNHDNSRQGELLHRYPLVQYRVHDGNAAIFAINEGVAALEKMEKEGVFRQFAMNGHPMPLEVVSRNKERGSGPQILPLAEQHRYRIYHYIPFTPENYTTYKSHFALTTKVEMLEGLLRNHIIAMLRGVVVESGELKVKSESEATNSPGSTFNAPLEITVNDIDRVKKVNVLGQNMMAFDLVFSANANLPEGIAIGRTVAFGFGVVIGMRG
jgi:hypothetical protein